MPIFSLSSSAMLSVLRATLFSSFFTLFPKLFVLSNGVDIVVGLFSFLCYFSLSSCSMLFVLFRVLFCSV